MYNCTCLHSYGIIGIHSNQNTVVLGMLHCIAMHKIAHQKSEIYINDSGCHNKIYEIVYYIFMGLNTFFKQLHGIKLSFSLEAGIFQSLFSVVDVGVRSAQTDNI